MVIVGGGFGGLAVARGLARSPVRVTVIDRCNHHVFQPLLYQVAMAGLSPADISAPIRAVLGTQANTEVLLAEVSDFDLSRRRVVLTDGEIDYDWLIVAAGARTSYFGHDAWAENAPGLKTLEDAIEIRNRVLLAFEAAERCKDASERERLLTFVVIGGGPTGVELAGALGELSRTVLARDFRHIDPAKSRVILVDGGPRVLQAFSPALSEAAREQLTALGVTVRSGLRVQSVDARGLVASGERIDAGTVLWAAGVGGSPLGARLGAPVDRAGRVVVGPDCAVPGHSNVFVIGDMALSLDDKGQPLPGLAPVALQQGQHVASLIRDELAGHGLRRRPFRYIDRGSMATIGRSAAVAQVGKLELRGFVAWATWLLIHILFLIDFRNRLLVMFNWIWNYGTYSRGARLITHARPGAPPAGPPDPRPPADR